MYFIHQKPKNLWLIGFENNNLYAIGNKNGHFYIYRKDFFEDCEWDEYAELIAKFQSQNSCKKCRQKMPVAAGIVESKLWIIASGMLHDKNPQEIKPYIFCVDLEAKDVKTFETENQEINDFIKNNCMKCDALQITFEDYLDGNPRFMVQPYQIKPAAPIISLSNPYPWFKQFFFDINDQNKTCNFGYFDNIFEDSKVIFVAGLEGNKFKFGLQRLMYDGAEQIPACFSQIESDRIRYGIRSLLSVIENISKPLFIFETVTTFFMIQLCVCVVFALFIVVRNVFIY